MDRNGFATVFFLFLILADVSDTSLLFNLRKFVVLATNDSVPDTPVTVPAPVEKKLDQEAVHKASKENKLDPKAVNEAGKDNKLGTKAAIDTDKGTKLDLKTANETITDTKLDPKSANETNLNPKQANDTSKNEKLDQKPLNGTGKGDISDHKPVDETTSKERPGPSVPKELAKEGQIPKSPTGTEDAGSPPEKKETSSDVGLVTDESCDGLTPRCTIQKDLIGCIKSFDDGSNVVVLVQNKGESNLKANLSVENYPDDGLEIPKKQSKRKSISLTNGKSAKIVLYAGSGKCVLTLGSPVSDANYLLRFPSYDKLVTLVNGAYLLILTALIFGGMWTCIKFSRRRQQGGGIPYQELEMGLPESVSAADLDTAEGWDQGWDDDWDEDNAVKSPGGRHVGSISANGLTARSTNKDGWEDNWDD